MKLIKDKLPNTQIFVHQLFPIPGETLQITKLFNQKLLSLSNVCTVIKCPQTFFTSDSFRNGDLFVDNLHLNEQGYKVWAEFLNSYFK